MITQIKNTLFRFTTLRAPELIEEEKINANFAKHPEFEKATTETFGSVFLQAAYHAATDADIKKVLIEQAAAFKVNAITRKEDIHKTGLVSKRLYDFAIWLSKNRTSLDYEQVMAHIDTNTEITRIKLLEKIHDSSIVIKLWDQLFYQLVTKQSAYVREQVLAILAAQFFLEKYLVVGTTKEALQKLAQARVIIPSILVEKGKTQTTTKTATATVSASLQRETNVMVAERKKNDLEASLAYLKRQQINYEKAEQKALTLAQKVYQDQVKALYAEAEAATRTFIDPETLETRPIKDSLLLEVPDFEYTPMEINSFLAENPLTKKGIGYVPDYVTYMLEMDNYDSFEALIAPIEAELATQTAIIFENSQTGQKFVNTNGVVLPLAETTSTNSFTISDGGTGKSSSYPLVLLFDTAFENNKITRIHYTVVFEDKTKVNDVAYSVQYLNSKLALTLFPQGLQTLNKGKFTLEGEIIFENNDSVTFLGNAVAFQEKNIFSMTYHSSGLGSYELLKDSGDSATTNYIPSQFGIKRVGILDYRRVEQEICCYVPGEVSHIENIMAREYKERATRRLRKSENTTTTTKEKESEHLTDSSTTDRYEMNQEVNAVLAEETHFGAFANVNGDYGKIKFSAGADFAYNTSSEESNHQALTHAKEVTEKVLDRVIQKVKEERISKIIEEFEENNKHGFDNTTGDKHISGVYRWIDKVYKNKVVNYGKRLMYEFMIPQPAAFHLQALEDKQNAEKLDLIEKPLDPRTVDSPLKLDENFNTRYRYWVQKYNVEIDIEPKSTLRVSQSFNENKLGSSEGGEGRFSDGFKFECKIPKDYACTNIQGKLLFAKGVNYKGGMYPGYEYTVHDTHFTKETADINKNAFNIPLNKIKDSVAITGTTWDIHVVTANVTLTYELTPEAYAEWCNRTFNAIIQAYEAKLIEYNNKMADLKMQQKEKTKTNPLFYREIENTVLHKNCMEYLTGHDIIGGAQPIKGKSLSEIVVVQNQELDDYAARVKFLEQAFEWNLLSYNLYPFYWAEKKKWIDLYDLSNVEDPIHKAFLQSGMARVMVTVRPGFEEAVNWYMTTGQIWNGGQVPTVNDPLFLSIVDELRVTTGKVEETWETRVPTSLTIIQAGEIGLEVDKALPCCEDRGDNPFGFSEEKTNLIEFSFVDMDGGNRITISDLDFPRVYKCQDQTITIDRDASWINTTGNAVIFEKLAEKLSLIKGINAKISISNYGSTDGITFTVDTNIIKDFSFIKPGNDPKGIDGLYVTIQDESVIIKNESKVIYGDRIKDKNIGTIRYSELNTLLPISRFLV